MQVIAFANQKGGVGKTTSAVNLADGLARQKLRVLLIDLDPQGQVALSFGFPKSPGLYHFLSLEEPLENIVINIRPNLDILAGDKSSEKVKRQIALMDFRDTILADHLQSLSYDVVLLDLAPSLDLLHINGLMASDWVVIPTRLDRLSIDGVKEILLTMAELNRHGKCYRGYSILPTFFERTTKETLLQFRELVQTFGEHVWPPIPQDASVRAASSQGKTLWQSGKSCAALQGFKNGRQFQGGYNQVLLRMLQVIYAEKE
jgi:chromosome partitioning protein